MGRYKETEITGDEKRRERNMQKLYSGIHTYLYSFFIISVISGYNISMLLCAPCGKNLIMQNEPKCQAGNIAVCPYILTASVCFLLPGLTKNEPKTNPNEPKQPDKRAAT